MRYVAVLFCLICAPAVAQDEAAVSKCDKTAMVVQQAVDARLDGDSKRKTRRMLSAELDRTAGEQLAEFIYGLPEDMLTDDVAAQFKAQCEAL